MAAMRFQMKTNDGSEPRRADAKQAEWLGIGWTDSSWELQHGLEVVEDLPADAWPQDGAAVPAQPTLPN